MKTRESKGMVRLEYFQNCLFWAYIEKKSAHSLFGAWSFLLVHIQFTPSERPIGSVNFFF
jgi:hypothetical protein